MKRRELLKLSAKACAFAGASFLCADVGFSFASQKYGYVCRLCRRENMKLFLRGDRCHTDKCALEKKKNCTSCNPKLIVNVSDTITGNPINESSIQIIVAESTIQASCAECHGANEGTLSVYPEKVWYGKFEYLDDDPSEFVTDYNGKAEILIDANCKIYIHARHPLYKQELVGALSIKDQPIYEFDIALDPLY